MSRAHYISLIIWLCVQMHVNSLTLATAECWPSTLFRCFFLLVFFSQEIANTLLAMYQPLCRWRNEKPAYWICCFRFSWICVVMRRTSESKTETNEKKKSSTAHSLAYEKMRQPTNRWMNKRNAKPKKTVYWCVGEWFAFNEVYFIFVLRSLNVFVCVCVCVCMWYTRKSIHLGLTHQKPFEKSTAFQQ